MYMLKIASVIIISLLAANLSFAQETIPKTSTTDIDVKIKKKKERPVGKRHYMTIIKTHTKNTLYGNKCFEDFTRQLGFTYQIQVKGQPGSLNGFTRFWHNAGTKTALVFTAWPWWKLRVNKRYKECRKSSGDFVG
jgi:hypothetical protein